MTIIRTKAQEAVLRVFQETLRRVRADILMRESCWRDGSKLYVSGNEYDLAGYRRVLVLGAGKASAAMALALDELLDGLPIEGLVVTKHGHALAAGRVEVLEAGHPLPDAGSLSAGNEMLQLARSATSNDLVVVLISGGASALMEALVDGVTLQDLQSITDALLRAGSDIHELNAVRSCLSLIKAGGLARACGDAELLCLLLSDVPGNPREVIGSGPCWGAPPSGTAALKILTDRGIPIPDSVRVALDRESDVLAAKPQHIVIGDIYTLLESAQQAAEDLGLKPKVYGRPFSGEAREVGARMAAEAMSLASETGKYDCVISAGETTVTVRGAGLGGRNQELACAAALALQDVPDVALISVGTDGTDGPTDAAGGLIDGKSYKLANFLEALNDNDSYHALENAAALIVTGPTQTNLNDLVVIARIPED